MRILGVARCEAASLERRLTSPSSKYPFRRWTATALSTKQSIQLYDEIQSIYSPSVTTRYPIGQNHSESIDVSLSALAPLRWGSQKSPRNIGYFWYHRRQLANHFGNCGLHQHLSCRIYHFSDGNTQNYII